MATNPSTNLWTEPESAANTDYQPQYPYNNITQTESGHSLELDDTPSRERVRLQHGKSKNFIEMHPNGDQVYKVYGDGYEIIAGQKNVLIKGTCNITIQGDCNMHVMGNKNEQVDGDYNLIVAGSITARAAGSKGVNITSDNDMTLSASSSSPNINPSTLYINADDHVYVSSDVEAAGVVSGDVLTSKTRINAGTGVYAGPLGIYSIGMITSLVSLNAPIANIPVATITGLMNATWMRDTVNSKIYNMHTHIGNRGFPTSPPLLPMI
jgi:hypothetical protein